MEDQAQIIEKKGKSVDEAVQAALDELNCQIEDVVVEIIEEPSKGLFGIVGKSPQLFKVSLIDKPENDVREVLKTY